MTEIGATTYELDKAAEAWADKYGRWIVWGFWPAALCICLFTIG